MAHPHISQAKYRADIDGLRAVAIIPVVAFHAFPTLLPGGFIGVDVFFVISGYLISTIIFEKLNTQSFSFWEFYSRRIKRIFPALITVLVATYSAGWIILLASEFKQLGMHLSAGAGFIANFIFWGEAGYFDSSAETKPLLHLWSLGIEEQFYIVWPFVVWLAWKSRVNLLLLIAVIACASFLFNIRGVGIDAVATFYSPQTRIWELLCGSGLAWLSLYKKEAILKCVKFNVNLSGRTSNPTLLSNICSTLGCILLIYGYSSITKTDRFPGAFAALPVLAAVLIIAAGPKAYFNRAFLSRRIAVWIGLISFPLYLWHWPLLSFATTIEGGSASPVFRASMVATAVLLAWGTYELIERPIRHNKRSNFGVFSLLALMFFIGSIGYITYENNGFPFRNRDREYFSDYFENSPPDWRFVTKQGLLKAYREECNFYDLDAYRYKGATKIPVSAIEKTCYSRNPEKAFSVFLWGDSHVQQFNWGISQNLPKDWQVLQVASSGCSATFNPNESLVDTNYCDKSNSFAIASIKSSVPNVVVIAQREGHNVLSSSEISNKLKAIGVGKVIFVGPTPRWTTDLPKIIARQLWFKTPERTFVGVDQDHLINSKRLAEEYRLKGLVFVDAISPFCNDEGCLTRLGHDRLRDITTHDYGHLLQGSSDHFAKSVLVDVIISN